MANFANVSPEVLLWSFELGIVSPFCHHQDGSLQEPAPFSFHDVLCILGAVLTGVPGWGAEGAQLYLKTHQGVFPGIRLQTPAEFPEGSIFAPHL